MLGALGAAMLDLGFTPEAAWSIFAVTRAFAGGAHSIEEIEREGYTMMGKALTPREDYDGPVDRPVPSLVERAKNAKPGQAKSLEEWKSRLEQKKKLYGSGHAIVEEIEDPRKIARSKKS
ncbi:hypothetical protein ES703_104618 [subsurface metagenome]